MKRVLMALMMISCLSSVIGCAKKKGVAQMAAAPAPGTFPGSPTTPGAGGSGIGTGPISFGAETPLTLSGGLSNLRKMFYKDAINNVSNLRFGMSIGSSGTGYAGEVWVKFEDGGRTREAVLSTNHPYSGKSDESQNKFITAPDGTKVFWGQFQDEFGAVVVILDETLTLGDGSPSGFVGGSIWFQNFNKDSWQADRQGQMLMCWQISRGPYDCRAALASGASGLYPLEQAYDYDVPYTLLGRFSSLNRVAAMGN